MPTKSLPSHELIDVSVVLSPDTVTYPGDPVVSFKTVKSPDEDGGALVHRFCMGSHSGTHIDAPAHMIRGGRELSQTSLQRLIGMCLVLDCTECERAVDAAALERKELHNAARILLRTRNSEMASGPSFYPDFVYLTPDGAESLVERGVLLVGIDYLSIGQPGPEGVRTHRTLLTRDVVILESLDLSRVDPGHYELICLPIKLDVPDGAPVRAVLRRV